MKLIVISRAYCEDTRHSLQGWWRRSMVATTTWQTGACSLAVSALLLAATVCGSDRSNPVQSSSSASDAYTFLYNMMDTYGSGSTMRLPPSYVTTTAFEAGDVAYVYDSDVAIIALLKRGNTTDLARAEVMGNAIIYAQVHDPAGDGRIRNSYHTDPLIRPNGAVNINDTGGYTGNEAWTGMALMQLYHATGVTSYLTAAESLAVYIQTTAYSVTGSGGYTAGTNAAGRKLTYKVTEHQIDLYGFFTMLDQASGNSAYTADAAHAYDELMALWNASGGYYYVGTLGDGATIYKALNLTPEDIQSWSYLATHLSSHQQSIDWALSNLSVTGGPFGGVEFDVGDNNSGVWFEGTAHMAAALRIRALAADDETAALLISDLGKAQSYGPNTNGLGIIASSINGLQAGRSDQYDSALHVGTTAWYCLAAESANPFTF